MRLGPRTGFTFGGLAVAGLIMMALLLGLRWHWLAGWLVAITVVAFSAYGWDKLCAIRGWFRIPEITLHMMSLAGGVVGACGGQLTFNHKTRRPRFRVVFVISALLWSVLLWRYVSWGSRSVE